MLRLRPSELTLTPEDVEETLARMAHRKTIHRPIYTSLVGQPGRPVLRRGPQRVVQDAITTLGDIPNLRPQPQQAVHASADEDDHDGSHAQPSITRGRHTDAPGLPVSGAEQATSTSIPTMLARRTLHLPFRFARSARNSTAQQSPSDPTAGPAPPAGTRPAEQTMSDVNDTAHINDTPEASRRSAPATPNKCCVELRGGGSRERARHAHRTANSSHSSSVHQTRECGASRTLPPPASPSPRDASSDEPVMHLQGFFTGRDDPSYSFEVLEPRTEPRPRTSRVPIPTRSASSGNIPAPLQHGQGHGTGMLNPTQNQIGRGTAPQNMLHQQRTLPTYDPTAPSFDPTAPYHFDGGNRNSSFDYRQNSFPPLAPSHNPSAHTSRNHFTSEGSSGAFSVYELPPESRHSSGGQSGRGSHHGQYDGSTASRHASRGAYHFVRRSDMPRVDSTGYVPTIYPMTNQHGVSPLPSMPYARHPENPGGGPLNSFAPYNPQFERPSTPYYSFPYGYTVSPYAIPVAPIHQYTDAATAVYQNLGSPLDPYADYYQQEMRQPHAGNEFYTQQGGGGHFSRGHHSPQRGGGLYGRGDHTPQRGGGIYGRGDHTPQRGGVFLGRGHHTPHSGPRDQQRGDGGRSRGRGSNQRSVGSFGDSYGRGPATSNDRAREAYDRIQQLQQAEYEDTLDWTNDLRHEDSNRNLTAMDRIARRNEQQTASNRTASQRQEQERIEANNPVPTMHDLHLDDAPEPPPRHSSRQEPTQRRQPGSLRPARDQPSTALALEHARAPTSRLSPAVRGGSLAPTRPRVPPHQRDQENSDLVETQAMQRESAAVASRYDQEAANDVMDETPPRIGNVERRLHE